MLKNLNFSLGESDLLIERQRPFFQEMDSICSKIYYYEARNRRASNCTIGTS